MRVVFMGTPDFASASLEKLIEEHFDVVGVFTQPDKPKGRGMKEAFSPVKETAMAHGIPVFQPEKMRDGTALGILKELNPDVLAVVAFGRLLPDDMLALPRFGAVNVHGSLLPQYRGSAPIQRAVLNGDRITGVSTMYLAHELDSGDIIYTAETEIREQETSGQLFDRLKDMGADLLAKTLRDIESGIAPRVPQDSDKVTYAPMLEKSESPIRWNRPAGMVLRQIYGLQPWPAATAEIGGLTCKIFSASISDRSTDKQPGELIAAGNAGIEIACADGTAILITELQAPGKKRMAAADYLRGHKLV